jgi:threonine/homoserine/homoserine lactone efflux protein
MFEFSQLALFMGATLALNLTPGPDMLYVATRSLGQGRKAGIASAFGIGVGCFAHIIAATLGLSAVLSYSATAFMVIKLIGAAYLIYLGIRTFMSRSGPTLARVSADDSPSKIFWQGVITNVLNPKVALFFLSFIPQFVHANHGSPIAQIATLGVLFDISGTSVLLIVALFFGQAGKWVETHPGFWRAQKWFTGSVFVALGAKLALTERQ